jgi:hypothetical protein
VAIAGGTVRLVVRFYSRGVQTGACESLDVPWAVGPSAAARLASVRLGRPYGTYDAQVPSLAGKLSDERSQFVARVDSTCARTLDGVDSNTTQLAALRGLPVPSDGSDLYELWLSNQEQRLALERRAAAQFHAGNLAGAQATLADVGALQGQGNVLGQQYGLQRCTAIGEDRTPVPLLSDGQPPPLP